MSNDSGRKIPDDLLSSAQAALSIPVLQQIKPSPLSDYIKSVREAMPGYALYEQMRSLPSYQVSQMLKEGFLGSSELLARTASDRLNAAADAAKSFGFLGSSELLARTASDRLNAAADAAKSFGFLGSSELLARTASDRLNAAAVAAKSFGFLDMSKFSNLEIAKGFTSYRELALGVGWVELQKSSLLYGYLTTHKSEALTAIEKMQDDLSSTFFNVDSVTWEALPAAQPKLEREIVEVIQGGGDLSTLSKEAKKYFAVFWALLWEVLNKTAIVATIVATGLMVQEKLDAAHKPSEVREAVKSIPEERRELLRGSSIVTGDNVIIRASATKDSAELGRLKMGTWVDNLGEEDSGWVYVSIDVGGDSVKGWIARRYLIAF